MYRDGTPVDVMRHRALEVDHNNGSQTFITTNREPFEGPAVVFGIFGGFISTYQADRYLTPKSPLQLHMQQALAILKLIGTAPQQSCRLICL
jgi:hypothetical protein